MDAAGTLPIEDIKSRLIDASGRGPVVLTAPTGSGKSTQVPRWYMGGGNVLVIEPRRVACRGLAQRVAQLEGVELGTQVGYTVREDNRSGAATRVLFATPGVVLRWWATQKVPSFETVILDEFHERGLETDLLGALLKKKFEGRLIVMSATMDAAALCRYLDAEHLHAPGRTYPVEIKHLASGIIQPEVRGIEHRVAQALLQAAKDPGDVLVFLPGKAEIRAVAAKLQSDTSIQVLEIHGGLSLGDQSRVFESGRKRRVILATNVAETSITIPGVGVVIDTGLVRRTRYFNGRGFLTLVPIAGDSADQRAGRAGRTAPGVCYRLWSTKAVMSKITPPAIHREALSPLLLATAACGEKADELDFPDAPKEYAMISAREDLRALGALDDLGVITDRGRSLYGMPLDPPLGSLLVEAEKSGCLPEGIDLVSALAVGRPLFVDATRPEDPSDDLRAKGCDVTALINAVRLGEARIHRLNPHILGEARSVKRRLTRAFNTKPQEDSSPVGNIDQLLRCAIRADHRCAYVARNRKGRVSLGNGGPELELARESAVEPEKLTGAIVLGTIAIGVGYRDSKIFATCAAPVRLALFIREGLGTDRVSHVTRNKGGSIKAVIERVYAGKVLEKREEVPTGELAREAIMELFTAGRIFPSDLATTKHRLESAMLARRLLKGGHAPKETDLGPWGGSDPIPPLEVWIMERLVSIGVESGKDLGLLSSGDLVPPALPVETTDWMEKRFPIRVSLKDVVYQVNYDLKSTEVTLEKISGNRKQAPSPDTIPAFNGFKVKVKHNTRVWVIRQGR